MKRFSHEQTRTLSKKLIHLCLSVFICGLMICFSVSFYSEQTNAESIEKQIDAAIYRREEFFGASAIVPIPTAKAYENLLKLNETNDPRVFAKLAEVAEKLEKFDEAENFFRKAENQDNLANFYNRRGNYEKSAVIQANILNQTKRLDVFERLINFGQLHELDEYLQPEFFQQVADESEDALPIIEKLIDKLVAENNKLKALETIRQFKSKFPKKMLEREVALISPQEAETVYYQSFNPFWTDEQSNRFYQFLNDHDRFRAYGLELKTKFRKNPDDYDTAIRLIHYKQYDYDEITSTVLQLEKAKKTWQADELLTIARFLLKEGNGDLASKFLYTLQTHNEFTPEMRGKISYQIFKILCEAENERLSLTKGDLSFYRDIASADTHPGITTGILSLIFSDTNPSEQLIEKERVATKLFNRAAAFRVFQNYKNEFPDSPEIGQMYLDLIEIYTKAKETDLAEKLLNEFAENYEKSTDFPRVAMNLADAFIIAQKPDKERQIYQKVLDYLGKKEKFFIIQKAAKDEERDRNSYPKNEQTSYEDLLGNQSEQIAYADVLSRYIESLSKEKKIAEILEIYSKEIAKYPDQEWLYEQRLLWLEQTNLFDQQLETYKRTLEKFPSNNWRDKLARWFIRNKKQAEFSEFSADLVEKLSDSEIESYLSQFVDGRAATDDFGKQLYLKLYQTAHTRFPHNINFVNSLLKFYKANNRIEDWQKLSAEYYFFSKDVRENFLNELARKGELRLFLSQSTSESVIYQLFRADAYLRLSHYEESLNGYRKLNKIYPNDQEFSEHLINLTRSFGQKERQILSESANSAKKRADFEPSNAVYRTESGEINAELGNYKIAKDEWQKLIDTGNGSHDTYLETASVFWDYFQYDDALEMIRKIRRKSNDSTLYAFESGAILESQHKQALAISEYLKALGNDDGKAQKRLKILAKNDDNFAKINAAFRNQTKSDWKTLRYAEILQDLGKNEQSENLLRQQIGLSKDTDFLQSAQDFSAEIEPIALKRLADISISPRKSISYRLKLADFYRENNQPNEAKAILTNLVQKFPTNYGVLTESGDFYWSLGANEAAIQVLQNGFARSKGDYRFAFASRLAKRLISLDRLAEAESFLVTLHQENPTDSEVFHELASVYVREGNAEKLRESFAKTVKAIKLQDIEPKQVDAEIAEKREHMISAFTNLKDHRSAVEQHIEIINREPGEQANVDAAIRYVKRYAEADLLLNYYQKTADEAFKNYRWNVVLAQIFEANGDAENAIKNYRKAIDNQPEMTELYAELVRIETNRKNYAEALKNLDKIIELSGEDKKLLKQKVQLMQLLGRNEEAKIEQEKLPVEVKPIIKPENQFAEADKAKSVEMFRQAFAILLEKPLVNELKGENITSYINTLRQEENVDVIAERLFDLREIYLAEINKKDSKLAGEARKRLQVVEIAMSNTIGNIAKTVGTNEELDKLHTNLSQRSEENPNNERLLFFQDFATRAGFGDLIEKTLIKRGNLQSLIEFYKERGAFEKVLEIAQTENNLPLIAENARLTGNREKELQALRQLFQDENTNQSNISRYLQIVDKPELEALSKQNSPHQLQLINFLLGNGEKALAHAAIANSNFQTSWKLSRHAETTLALKEFDETSECYFCDALNLGTIGEMITTQPDKTQQLIGTDWLLLSREYGEWLDAKKEFDANKFLPAMTENLPKDASEQVKLGKYYLAKNELAKAREHFELSLELDNENAEDLAIIGETLWRLGDKQKAVEVFEKVLSKSIPIYLQTMQRLGLEHHAQENIIPILVQKEKKNEDLEEFLYPIAKSFDNERSKAEFLLKLTDKLKDSTLVLQKIIQNELIALEFRQLFYEKLFTKMEFDSTDYEFETIARRAFSNEDAEEIYDHEKDFAEANRERNDKYTFQYDYLEFLLKLNKTPEAKKLILQIESEMKGKFPRPFSLRLKHFQLFSEDLEKIVSIRVTDNVKDIKPPSIERLNEAVMLLKNLKRDDEAEKLTIAFYSRMLELENFETVNFIGLARQNFKLGDTEKAFAILKRLFEIENFNDYKAVAEVYAEFGFPEKAIEFRQKLTEISPNDFENKFELAKLLANENAIPILQSLVNERNTPRSLRWQAILKLHELGEIGEIPNIGFDAYSQFYNGNFVNSLIADKAAETQAMQQLMRVYASEEKHFAVLKLAEIDKTAKSNELLDLLSKSAEKVGEFSKAIEFEKAKSKADGARIKALESLEIDKNKRVTDFTVDAENVRKL